MHIFLKLAKSELVLLRREPMVAAFGLFFPTVLVIILGCIPSFREPTPDLGGLRVIDFYVPITLALILAMIAFQTMPQILATYREKGILRRLATTPARPVMLLGAQVTVMLAVAIASAVLVLVVGRVAFDVALPAHPLVYAVSFLLCAAAVLSIGVFVAAVAPSGKAAGGIGMAVFFPSIFFAGVYTPREVMPDVLQRIGEVTPLGAGQAALQAAGTGHWPSMLSVTVVAAYLAVFGFAAARFFRWE
ncbi:ABC transporter permease [Actinoplanes sp. NPDC051633]|uniref:ABC transporter permease n=1 Tax=Actinoplanes sp. NPDC051633 TaxID=3155670 RepID=UPI003449B0DB